jgi:hypothetical protein
MSSMTPIKVPGKNRRDRHRSLPGTPSKTVGGQLYDTDLFPLRFIHNLAHLSTFLVLREISYD